ncbi:TetR family transcriptional regulator [Enterococcus villorum]|uniref:TetR family transcriptional regulator n=1 Tax=Enterococcus villorum TaxID=112904 RepID=A0A1V8YFN0_9ENTE|nr:TetR/AcrR family transcriptional regulator [Enterococcus villorum]OQO71425.1 TetR family transcriptional regulator [Enterococcus villorum]OQO76600.1 TetR family transcriptional regulator [Enterococcus villorum]
MPKATFLNLSSSKKQRILEILLQNFSNRHMQVKVADIVEGMGMSRGAFYKYFEDLEDAYTYTIHHYSIYVYHNILKSISNNQKNFFQGIESYLAWCTTLDRSSSDWLAIQLLTKSNDVSTQKRITSSSESKMLKEWFKLLEMNDFSIKNEDEALSFLYFVMELIIQSLTDFITNDWTNEQLLQDFHYKVKWLTSGLTKKEK